MTDDEISEILLPLMPLKDPYVFARAIAAAEREKWAQICDGFDAVNPHIGQAAEVAKLLRSNAKVTGSPALSASPSGLTRCATSPAVQGGEG